VVGRGVDAIDDDEHDADAASSTAGVGGSVDGSVMMAAADDDDDDDDDAADAADVSFLTRGLLFITGGRRISDSSGYIRAVCVSGDHTQNARKALTPDETSSR
jgi:hypothetical protein